MNTERKRFGHTTPTVMGGSGVVPRRIKGDAAQDYVDRTIGLLCDADVGEVERRYGLPFRAERWIIRENKNTWVITDTPPEEDKEDW